MKKLLIIALVLCLALGLTTAIAQEKVYKVGIAQLAVHGSLDNCYTGFIEGMKEQGFIDGENVEYELQNAQADPELIVGIANRFATGNYDLVVAIATPMAQACFNSLEDKIPLIYSAVSFPQNAGLATEEGLGIGNTTGTSDRLAVAKQLQAIRALQPEAEVVGILYTLSEINSVLQVEEFTQLAPEYGFRIEPMGIATGADVALAAPILLSKVDLVTMVLDNTVVQYLDTVLEAAEEKKIPIYGSEIEQVVKGCAAAEGIDYIDLGRRTGELAARVLRGEDAQSLPFIRIENTEFYYNQAQLDALQLTLPEALALRGIAVD